MLISGIQWCLYFHIQNSMAFSKQYDSDLHPYRGHCKHVVNTWLIKFPMFLIICISDPL